MEKFSAGTETCGFGFSTGSINCPYDMAESLMDWNDGIKTGDIYEIIDDIHKSGGLNEFGKKMFARITGKYLGSPHKFGMKKEDYESLIKEYEVWKDKSGIVDGDGGESKRRVTKFKIEKAMSIPQYSEWKYDNKEELLECYSAYLKDMIDGDNDLTQISNFYLWCDHEYNERFKYRCSKCESLNLTSGVCSDCGEKSKYKEEWDRVVEENDWAQEIYPIKRIV